MFKKLAILADDLTGAADSCAYYAQHGLNSLVPLALRHIPPADVISIPINSRDVEPDDARRLINLAFDWLIAEGFNLGETIFYHKIDSLMRGNPVEELYTLAERVGANIILLAPAFPSQGRVTVNGKQWMIRETSMQAQWSSPTRRIDLIEMFSYDLDNVAVQWASLQMVRKSSSFLRSQICGSSSPLLIICDAESDTDLDILADIAVGCGVQLVAGSAGFARRLCKKLYLEPTSEPLEMPKISCHPVLTVVGSRNPRLARQVDVAQSLGIPIIRPEQGFFDEENAQNDAIVSELSEQLIQGKDVILTTHDLQEAALGRWFVSLKLGEVVRSLVQKKLVGGLVLTGGETANAVCSLLNARAISMIGEVRPGVALGRLYGGMMPGLPIITKAGGFGDDKVFLRAIRAIHRRANYL